jgi:hypothetical protein
VPVAATAAPPAQESNRPSRHRHPRRRRRQVGFLGGVNRTRSWHLQSPPCRQPPTASLGPQWYCRAWSAPSEQPHR